MGLDSYPSEIIAHPFVVSGVWPRVRELRLGRGQWESGYLPFAGPLADPQLLTASGEPIRLVFQGAVYAQGVELASLGRCVSWVLNRLGYAARGAEVVWGLTQDGNLEFWLPPKLPPPGGG